MELCACLKDINVLFAVIFTILRKETLIRGLHLIRPSRSYPTPGPARYAVLQRMISKNSPESWEKNRDWRNLRMEETENGRKEDMIMEGK
jgi:hypothetical protein